MRVLAGDVGGTKTLLAVVEVDGDSVRIGEEARYSSPEYPGLASVLREFLARVRGPVEAACLGVPGAVLGGACRTPNLPWYLTEEALRRETGIPGLSLINDFAAAALGVLGLDPASLATLQEGVPESRGTRAVIGAGTGLGQAILVWNGRHYMVNPTEAGHAGFAASGEVQRSLVAHLESTFFPVSVERILSGPGLVRIYDFLVSRGVSTWPEVREAFGRSDPGAVIAEYALSGRDLACDQAIDLFVAAYGAEAGNLALRTLATGGVYVAGGIAPKILARLRGGAFVRAFRDRGRMTPFLERIPVHVVLETRSGLIGAALAAARRLTSPDSSVTTE